MTKLLLPIFLLIVSIQARSQHVTVNFTVDTAVFDVAGPLRLWQDFLNTKDDGAGARYWNRAEVAKYGDSSYFLIENDIEVGTDNYLKFLSYGNVHVLTITEIEEFYKIKSILSFNYQDKNNVYYIFNVYAAREDGQLKLFNPLPVNTRLFWQSRTHGLIRYHFPREHEFESSKADSLNSFLVKLGNDFEVQTDTIDYYFAPTSEEMLRVRGYDYFLSEGGKDIANGYAHVANKTVFTVGMGEYYPHETVHVFLNDLYKESHQWATEGLAVWLGGSRGRSLDWHLGHLAEHLEKHPEVDLDTMLRYSNIDEYAAYKYPLGGFVIRSVFEKEGLAGVKRFMGIATGEKEYYKAVEKMLGVRQEDLNEYLRRELSGQ